MPPLRDDAGGTWTPRWRGTGATGRPPPTPAGTRPCRPSSGSCRPHRPPPAPAAAGIPATRRRPPVGGGRELSLEVDRDSPHNPGPAAHCGPHMPWSGGPHEDDDDGRNGRCRVGTRLADPVPRPAAEEKPKADAKAELKVGDPAPELHAAGLRRQDLQAVGLQGKEGGRRSPGSPRRSRRAAPSSASRWRRTATRSGSTTSPTSWPASTRSRTTRATRPSPSREKADFPMLSDPTKDVAKAYGVLTRARLRQPLDVLHRQGRQDRRHRQGREAGDVGRRHGRQARGVEGRGEVSRTAAGHAPYPHAGLVCVFRCVAGVFGSVPAGRFARHPASSRRGFAAPGWRPRLPDRAAVVPPCPVRPATDVDPSTLRPFDPSTLQPSTLRPFNTSTLRHYYSAFACRPNRH